jgi:hypothetical protein
MFSFRTVGRQNVPARVCVPLTGTSGKASASKAARVALGSAKLRLVRFRFRAEPDTWNVTSLQIASRASNGAE